MGCIECGTFAEETWEHFISCDPHGDIWNNVHKLFTTELREIFKKHAHKDITDPQIDRLLVSLVGTTADSTLFHLFKQHACEGKITSHFSVTIRNHLRLSPAIGVKVDALILLTFLHLFKSLVWIPRCVLQVAWEERKGINQRMKLSRSWCSSPEQNAMPPYSINTPQPLHNPLIQPVTNEDHVQVLDDIPTHINEDEPINNLGRHDKMTRRMEAAKMTWSAITNYARHNYFDTWIPRLTKYFNKVTKIGDDIWDMPVSDNVQ